MRPPGPAAAGDNTQGQAMNPFTNGVSPAPVHMSMGGTPNLLPDRWQQVYKQQEQMAQMAQMAPGQPHCFGTRSEPMVMPLAPCGIPASSTNLKASCGYYAQNQAANPFHTAHGYYGAQQQPQMAQGPPPCLHACSAQLLSTCGKPSNVSANLEAGGGAFRRASLDTPPVLPPSRLPQQHGDLTADISCSKTEGGSDDVEAYGRKEGHNEREHAEESGLLLLLLLISIMVCSQLTEQERGCNPSTVQMSKRQAKRKRRQLQQNQARQARAAQLADAAAERAAERSRAEVVAAERKAASARPANLPDIAKKGRRAVVEMATVALGKAVEGKEAAPEPSSKMRRVRVKWVGGSWGAASLRTLESALREEEKARSREKARARERVRRQRKRRAAAARPAPEQMPGSVNKCGGMWVQRVVAHLGDRLAGISCWLHGAVQTMLKHVAGTIPSETLSHAGREKTRPALQVGRSWRSPASARRLRRSALKALRNQTEEKRFEDKPPASRAPAREHLSDAATAAGQLPQEEGGDIADARPWPKVSVEQLAATRAPGEVRPLRRPAWKGQLFVRVNGGKTQVLHNVSSDDTVGVIRSRVRGHHRLAQWMTWAGKSLQDDRTLASYGIGKESTLTLAWRLLGGGAKTKVDPQEASAAGAGVEWAPREELSEAERAAAVRMRMRSGPETHPGVPKCQEESCIREACRDLPIADLSAGWEIEALLNVMDTYPAHFGIVTRACKCLAAKSDIEPGTVVRLGGIDKIVAAMAKHQSIADLQMWACTALANCSCRDRAATVKIAEVGGIARILSAMEFFKERADVQLAACQCLLQVSSESQLQGVIKGLGGEECIRRAMAAPNADASLRDVVGPSLLSRVSSRNLKGTVKETHSKLCMDPNSLVRKGKFGDIQLFDSTLDQHIGFMDARPLRAMYAEHVMAPGSQEPFSPPNHPGLICTPEGEFNFVVGENGVDTKKWELKPGARPTCAAGSMVPGRNDTALEDLLKMPQVG